MFFLDILWLFIAHAIIAPMISTNTLLVIRVAIDSWGGVITSTKILYEISNVLKYKRFNDGALRLEHPNVVFLFDEYGIPYASILAEWSFVNAEELFIAPKEFIVDYGARLDCAYEVEEYKSLSHLVLETIHRINV